MRLAVAHSLWSHLVSAVLHRDAVVAAQYRVPDKTNEITSVEPLFANLDIQGAVVTGDVKDDQRTLCQDIADLPFDAFSP
jgi:hypothetical protein